MKPFDVAVLSPPGEAALGVVGLRGEAVAALIRQLFRPRARTWNPAQSAYGTLTVDGETLDDVVVVPVGGDSFMVTLHGNPTLLHAFEQCCLELGGERPDNLLQFSSGFVVPCTGSSSIRAEALETISSIGSLKIATWLLAQSDPTEDGFAAWVAEAASGASVEPATEAVVAMSARRWGIGLLDPPTVVLSGPPNAGKSTLFNRFVGRPRVVEDASPGTTRDLIVELVYVREFPIRLVDGAGLRSSDDFIEQEGVRRMERVRGEADLVVELVPPGASEISDGRADLGTRALKIRSRFDQILPVEPGDDGLLGVSGQTGDGVELLERTILQRLYGIEDLPSDPAPFTMRQIHLLDLLVETMKKGGDTRALWAQF